MHLLIPIFIMVFAGLFGLYFLFIDPTPALGVHFLLLTLYFLVTFYETRGQPFGKFVYYLLVSLLVADGIYFLFFFSSKYLLSGIISLFFAFSAWISIKRIYR